MNDQPHGQGKRTYPNGDIYVGDFVQGKRHGDGKLTRAKNGWVFESKWVDDELPHRTKICLPGRKYIGDLVGLKKHGKGKITHPNGEVYVGDLRDYI